MGETILKYENAPVVNKTKQNAAVEDNAMETNNTDSNLDAVFQINNNRCTIDMLLDNFVHLDPQIVNKELDIQHRLLFEMRNISDFRAAITQPYLLSLFIHQAGWQKLFDCVQYLFSPSSVVNHSK